jgi:hypothetical protein
MAGGYGKEIQATVDIHFQTIQTALQYQKQFIAANGKIIKTKR